MFTENTAAFLADFGLSATVGAVTATVLLDQPDEEVLSGRAMSRAYDMTYRVADFPTLARGDAVTVAAASYTVYSPPRRLDDGVFAVARLEAQ